MKKVLITGANSYIGTSFEQYVSERYKDDLSIDTIDMIDGTWRQKDFSSYDIIFHVAGLAHADDGNVSFLKEINESEQLVRVPGVGYHQDHIILCHHS